MAKLAEQAERYDDMVEYIKLVAGMGELSPEERNLLSVAYKNMVGSRRLAWREVSALEAAIRQDSPAVGDLVNGYKTKVAEDLTAKCNEIINLLSKDLIEKASGSEDKVFYTKMKGDYYRYMAESAVGDEHAALSKEALDAYASASQVAQGQLKPANPIRLGLALNFSVFYNEVYHEPEKACTVARKAYDDAAPLLEDLPEEEFRDSAGLVQLLRDNLQLWMQDTQTADGSKPPELDGTEDL